MFHKLLHSRPEPLSEYLFQYASATSARSRRKPFQLLLPPPPPHTHTPHATENLFSIDRLFYGTHFRTTYNHSRIVNHFVMLSRATTNHINLPQQKTFTYHSPLPFLNLQIVCTHIPDCVTSQATIFLQPLNGDPLDQGSSLLGNPKYDKFNNKFNSRLARFRNTSKPQNKCGSCSGLSDVITTISRRSCGYLSCCIYKPNITLSSKPYGKICKF